MEQRKVETPGSTGLPQSLDLHHEEDFLEKRSHQVPAVFLDPLFVPDMANAVYQVLKPPVLSKASPFAGGSKVPSTSTQPDDDGPEPEMPTQSTSDTGHQVQAQVVEVSDTDSDKTEELATEKESPPQVLTVKVTRSLWKRPMTGSSRDGATPSKMRKEKEVDDTETTTSTGPLETALKAARFKIYDKDFPEVKEVRAKILGLPEGEVATQQVLDSSPTFQLRRAADESCTPTVIGERWVDYLESKGHLANCKPNDFNFAEEWLPLYTRAGVTKQISGLSPLLNRERNSPLIAVIPPDMAFQYEREYVIHQLHKPECLSRVSVYYDNNQQKQVAFCPYCGVMNENSATAYSHARKHLGITFLCGSCYGKLYKAPQHLFNHMQRCCPCTVKRQEKEAGSQKGGDGK